MSLQVSPPEETTSVDPSPASRQSAFHSFTVQWRRGLLWAILSPLFLGSIPIFAKLAYQAGADALTVVALRTTIAAVLMWVAALTIGRHFIGSSRPAIAGSLIAGAINGAGSIFFYASLTLIGASLGQLINITYLVFVTLLLRLSGQTVSYMTLGRTALAVGAIYLLTAGGLEPPNWLGVGLMIVAALSYAVQLVLGQRILLDIPAPTMALYAIAAMALVVNLTWLFLRPGTIILTAAGWQAILLMGLATALSRLTLFQGVKHLGSIQTALLGVLEVIVTIIIASTLLDETLSAIQWLGAALLLISVLLVRFEHGVPHSFDFWTIFLRLRGRTGK